MTTIWSKMSHNKMKNQLRSGELIEKNEDEKMLEEAYNDAQANLEWPREQPLAAGDTS